MSDRNLLAIEDIAKELDCSTSKVICYKNLHQDVAKFFKKRTAFNGRFYIKKWFVLRDDLPELKKTMVKITAVRKKYVTGGERGFAWTRTALECLEARMVCKNCPNSFICLGDGVTLDRGKPPMKWKVIEIIRRYGLPRKESYE